MEEKRFWGIGSPLWLGLSIGSFVISFYFALNTFLFLKKSAETTGTIISVNQMYRTDKVLIRAKIPLLDLEIEFNLANGLPEIDEYPSKNLSLKLGDPIDIFYDPTNPRKICINNFSDLWESTYVPMIVGIFLMAAFLIKPDQ